MELFCHITEFGQEGMANVPAMLSVSDRVTLWSPPAGHIDLAWQRGHSFLTSKDVLELVYQGRLQLMGRRTWFAEPTHRAKIAETYPEAVWVPDFDNAIYDIARQDESDNKALENRRVVMVDPEPGAPFAEEAWADPERDEHAQAIATARMLLAQPLTPGLTKKLSRCTDDEQRVKAVIRDVRNHHDAYEHSQARMVSILAEEASVYAQAVAPVTREPVAGELHFEHLLPLLEILQRVAQPTPQTFKKMLKSRALADARTHAADLLASTVDVALTLRTNIDAGTPSRSVRQLFGDPNWISGCSAIGLAAAFAGFQVSPDAAFGLAAGLAPPLARLGQQVGALPTTYDGWRFPFLLAFGTAHPRRRQIKQLMARLDAELTRVPRT